MYDFVALQVYVSVQLELMKLGTHTLVVGCAGRIWVPRWTVACATTKLHFGLEPLSTATAAEKEVAAVSYLCRLRPLAHLAGLWWALGSEEILAPSPCHSMALSNLCRSLSAAQTEGKYS